MINSEIKLNLSLIFNLLLFNGGVKSSYRLGEIEQARFYSLLDSKTIVVCLYWNAMLFGAN